MFLALLNLVQKRLFFFILVAVAAGLGFGYFTGGIAFSPFLCLFAALIMIYHYRLIADRGRDGCFKAFLHNNWVGAAVFAGIVGEYLSRARDLAWIWN